MLTGSLIFTLFLSQNYSGCALGTMLAYGLAFVLTLFLDEVKEEEQSKNRNRDKSENSGLLHTIKVTLKDIRFLCFLVAEALMGNASWLISVMLNQDKYLQVGLNEQQMGIIAIVISVAGLFSVSSAFFVRRLGVIRFLMVLCLIMGGAGLLMGFTEIAVVAVFCNFVVDFGYGLITPLINELENRRVKVSDRATQLSVYGMCIDLVSIGLSVLVSAVAGISFFSIFVLTAVEFVLAILLAMICYRE